jgi:L-threonylcarbamoyladenylate synthase
MKRIDYQALLRDDNIKLVRRTINDHGIICYPTDTLYGLGGNIHSAAVCNKIDRMKMRSGLPYSVAVSEIRMVAPLVETVPDIFRELASRLLPGKFTLLLPAAADIPAALLKKSTKIGIRIPDIPEIRQLISRLEQPLISTSVNRSNQPPLNDPDRIAEEFPEIDLMIDRGPLRPSRGSTILDLTTTPVTCVRRGDDFEIFENLGIEFISA